MAQDRFPHSSPTLPLSNFHFFLFRTCLVKFTSLLLLLSFFFFFFLDGVLQLWQNLFFRITEPLLENPMRLVVGRFWCEKYFFSFVNEGNEGEVRENGSKKKKKKNQSPLSSYKVIQICPSLFLLSRGSFSLTPPPRRHTFSLFFFFFSCGSTTSCHVSPRTRYPLHPRPLLVHSILLNARKDRQRALQSLHHWTISSASASSSR